MVKDETTGIIVCDDARMGLYGRILRCPFGDNPAECPLHEIRKQSVAERVSWVESLSDDEANRLYALHKTCLGQKMTEKASADQ